MTEQSEDLLTAYHPESELHLTFMPEMEDIDVFIAGNTSPTNLAEGTGSILILLATTAGVIHPVRLDAVEGQAPTAHPMTLFIDDEELPIRLRAFNPATAPSPLYDESLFQSFGLGDGCLHLLSGIQSEQHLLQILHHAPNGPLFMEGDILAFFGQVDGEATFFAYELARPENSPGGVWQLLSAFFDVEENEATQPTETAQATHAPA